MTHARIKAGSQKGSRKGDPGPYMRPPPL
ncbi:hypothetical protein RSAG8_08249, partial [Rhizoctonia solani AG-8 WAC10335]